VPASVRRLLAKCLEKDHRKRLHDIGDAWELIDDRPSSPAVVARTPWLAWGVAAVFLASTVALAVLHFTETPPQPAGARFQIAPPEKTRFDIYLSLSPDGRRLAFTAGEPGAAVHLWVRDLESLEARRLPGTEGAASPFWSPDSRYIGFAEGARLKKIDLAGGQPQIIAESPAMVGVGAWGRDGVIVFGSRGGLGGIRRVADTGGDPVEVTTVAGEAGESLHSFPFFLPDGRRFLYFCASGRPEVQGIYVGSIDGSAAPRAPRLVAATMGPVIIAAEGQAPKLFFVRDGTLLAQSFDANRVQLSGTPTPVAERLGNIGSFAFFSVAANVLTFRTGTSTGNNLSQLTWLGRKGEPLGTLGEPRQLTQNPDGLVISPDGRQAAIVVGPVPSDVWVVEFARGIATRATFDSMGDVSPVWSPDGNRLTFRSNRANPGDIYQMDLRSSKESLLLKSPEDDVPTDWSSDGRFLLFNRFNALSGDVWVLDAEGQKPIALLESPFSERGGQFSPDGRWVAYVSNESGADEIYVRPFAIGSTGVPAVGPKWRVSTAGGVLPRWRGDGKELFFWDRSGAIAAVDVVITGASLETSVPRQLFMPSLGTVSYDVMRDGQRFLLAGLQSFQTSSPDPVTVVLNWQSAHTAREGR
jgi:Tol biopolymer transport system component